MIHPNQSHPRRRYLRNHLFRGGRFGETFISSAAFAVAAAAEAGVSIFVNNFFLLNTAAAAAGTDTFLQLFEMHLFLAYFFLQWLTEPLEKKKLSTQKIVGLPVFPQSRLDEVT